MNTASSNATTHIGQGCVGCRWQSKSRYEIIILFKAPRIKIIVNVQLTFERNIQTNDDVFRKYLGQVTDHQCVIEARKSGSKRRHSFQNFAPKYTVCLTSAIITWMLYLEGEGRIA